MIDPGPLASYVGFTEEEVQKLCQEYEMDAEEVKNWYDGYSFEKGLSVYSPRFSSKLYAPWKDWKLLESDRNL